MASKTSAATRRRGKSRPGRRASGRIFEPLRYAVVGLGWIAQHAVLPAFAHARKHAALAAIVSDDDRKLRRLGEAYRVPLRVRYEDYQPLLESGRIDAVYIALPNNLHAAFAIQAAEAGVHVLCEKPMAVREDECLDMMEAARRNRVKLMIAYRLHFDPASLRAVELVQRGRVGEARFFDSVFSMNVKDVDNIRLSRDMGGGPLHDIGIYCINAARYLFRSEPIEVFASAAIRRNQRRFREVDEMISAVMRFPSDRLATFTCSFGASDIASYRVVGTKGDLLVEPAYEYAEGLKHVLTVGGRKKTTEFAKRDQFAPELIHFAQCVRENRQPEPDARDGMADVRIIQALYESARTGRAVALKQVKPQSRPGIELEIKRPPLRRRPLIVNANSPSRSA